MKIKLTIILLVALLSAAASPKTGYMVATTGTEGVNIQYISNVETVQQIFNSYFPGSCVSIASELRHSLYFEITTQRFGFYVELKKISKKGKYQRISNKQFKNMYK